MAKTQGTETHIQPTSSALDNCLEERTVECKCEQYRSIIVESYKKYKRQRCLAFIFLVVAFLAFLVTCTLFHPECIDIMPNSRQAAVPIILAAFGIPVLCTIYCGTKAAVAYGRILHCIEHYPNGKFIVLAFGGQLEKIVNDIAKQNIPNTSEDFRD